MDSKRKIVIIISILLLGGTGFFYFSYYNKPNTIEIRNVKTEHSVTSESIVASFTSDETLANTIYLEKTVEVEGVIKDITFLNNRYTIILQGENEFSCLLCDMLPHEINAVKKLRQGQTVKLKGVCKGYLMDVIMLNCALLN